MSEDYVVSVDGGTDAGDDALCQPLVLTESDDGFDIFVGQRLGRRVAVLLGDVVGQQDGGEDGESLRRVERSVVVVGVDAGQFDFVAGFAQIAQVAQEDGVLGARQAPSHHLTRRLLNGNSLVVLIDCLLHVDLVHSKIRDVQNPVQNCSKINKKLAKNHQY